MFTAFYRCSYESIVIYDDNDKQATCHQYAITTRRWYRWLRLSFLSSLQRHCRQFIQVSFYLRHQNRNQ